MAQLAEVAIAHRVVEFFEQGQTFGGDADANRAAVLGRSFANDPTPLGKLIEQSGNIRGARYEPGLQHERGQGARMFGAQQSQGVVLLGSQIITAE